MPELPEVETIKNYLSPKLENKRIIKVEIIRRQNVLNEPTYFINNVEGRTIENVTRIGKYLIFNFDNDYCFYSHLRMEGKYFILKNDENLPKYPKVIFFLSDNIKLVFDDMRCFGFVKVCKKNELKNEKEIKKLGQEPFYIDDIDSFYQKVFKKKDPIKVTLLDQSIICGLGNIYADETLFKSKINPLKPTYFITKNEWKNIIQNAQDVLNLAIKNNGSTIKSFKIGKDHIGSMQNNLEMYGKKHSECKTCKRNIRFTRVGGRGTSFCPNCQPHDFLPINIAITGPIGSGKSTVTNILKEHDIKTLSCDEIVHNLYNSEEIINYINELYNLSFKDKVDRDILRNEFLKDIKKKKKLEKYIHLKVIEIIKGEMKKNHSILAIEVPLLYETKIEELFDFIIIVDSKKKDQLLKNRNPNAYSKLKEINANNESLKHLNDADLIIHNDKEVKDIENVLTPFINKWKHLQN